MKLRRPTIAVFALVALVLTATMPLYGQDRDSRGRDDRDSRGRDDKDSRGRDDFDVEKFLKKLDDNGDGMIEASEVNRDRTRRYLKGAGEDLSKPFKIKSFMKKVNKKKKSSESVAQKSLGFSVVEQEREVAAGASPGFAIVEAERNSLEQARTREFDAAAKKMTEWVLGKYDRNDDEIIDSEEIKSGRWEDPPAKESDTNNDGALSKLELLIRYQDREDRKAAGKGGGDRDRGRDDDRDRGKDDRGRGGDRWDRERSRFDSPSEKGDSSSTTSSNTGTRDVRKGYESYVDGIFKSYDKNTDGFLDKEELSKMRRKPSTSADADGDSKISKSELVEAYLVKAGKSKGSTKGSSSAGSSKSKSKSTSGAAGSRSQLTDKDENGNGQIEMAEYETDWTVEKIDEFNVIDTNRDGVITKAEWDAK